MHIKGKVGKRGGGKLSAVHDPADVRHEWPAWKWVLGSQPAVPRAQQAAFHFPDLADRAAH